MRGDARRSSPRRLEIDELVSAAAVEHFAHTSHLMEPLMATASVTGEVLRNPNPKMQLGKGEPKLFTPWLVLEDQGAATTE